MGQKKHFKAFFLCSWDISGREFLGGIIYSSALDLNLPSLTGPNWQDPTKPGDLQGGKMNNSGGWLIKTAFASCLERAIRSRIWTIWTFRYFGPFWGEFGHFGVNFPRLRDKMISKRKAVGSGSARHGPLLPLGPFRPCFIKNLTWPKKNPI